MEANGAVLDHIETELDFTYLNPETIQKLLSRRGIRTIAVLIQALLNKHELTNDLPLRWELKPVMARLNWGNLAQYTRATLMAVGMMTPGEIEVGAEELEAIAAPRPTKTAVGNRKAGRQGRSPVAEPAPQTGQS